MVSNHHVAFRPDVFPCNSPFKRKRPWFFRHQQVFNGTSVKFEGVAVVVQVPLDLEKHWLSCGSAACHFLEVKIHRLSKGCIPVVDFYVLKR